MEFLTDEQAEAYGTFTEAPARPELERFFFLDDDDRDLIALRRTDAHRLGAVQVCTVRYVGRFLGEDTLAVPWEVVEYCRLREQVPAAPVSIRRVRDTPRTARPVRDRRRSSVPVLVPAER